MDLEDWEYLTEDGFFDLHEDSPRKKPLPIQRETFSLQPNSLIDMNYFQKFTDPHKSSPRVMNQVVPLKIAPIPEAIKTPVREELPGEATMVPFNTIGPPKIGSLGDSELRIISQASSFNKMEETQFADMKLDSPKSLNRGISITITPQVDLGMMDRFEEKGGDFNGESVVEKVLSFTKDEEKVSQVFFKKIKEKEFVDMRLESPKSSYKGFTPRFDVGADQFEEEDRDFNGESVEKEISWSNLKEEEEEEEKVEVTSDENHGCLNMLRKWGFGAICSFGFAAATICVIVLSSGQKGKHNQQKPNLHFQIYTDDKRIKQVMQHATKLNEAMSAVRGSTLARAHITVGGYFEAL
ncbi:hypothetical protein Dimus_001807 [Dionaea muscipula]